MAQSEYRTTGRTTETVGFRLQKSLARDIKKISRLPPDSLVRRRLRQAGYSATVNGFLRYLVETDDRVQLLLTDIESRTETA